jgi:type IV secretory pathway TrbL component
MSNMYGAAGGGMHGNSPTFKITMKKYEDMAIKVGDKVGIEVKKVDRYSGV